MPVFKRSTVLELGRGLRAFVNLEAGLVRDAGPGEALRGGVRREPLRPENIVWIFGTGRGGSTWLRSMMGEPKGFQVWEEPMVGRLFGDFYEGAQKGQRAAKSFVMGEPHREEWIRLIREFVLGSIAYRRPKPGPGGYLIVKEPHGSVGAPLLMEALPESRMLLLVRDPRDVAASNLDATKKGSWLYERRSRGQEDDQLADREPDTAVERRARRYLKDVGGAKRAYDAHKGRKALVRYEELRKDPLEQMQRLYAELGIEVDKKELIRSVEKHSWENIPEEQKGEGRFYRKASPGGWREELTPKQVEIVERITAPLLEEFYPDEEDPHPRFAPRYS